jgi:hypothetical protein
MRTRNWSAPDDETAQGQMAEDQMDEDQMADDEMPEGAVAGPRK